MSRVLVTGAAGFAGGHLIDLLTQTTDNPDAIVAWHRPASSHPDRSNASRSIQWQAVDMLDREAVLAAVADARPSVVYHLAGSAHVGQSWSGAAKTLQTNVIGTHNLLRGLHTAGVTARVLIPGSAYVYRSSDRPLVEDDPIAPASPYALSKLAQEMLGRRGIDEDKQQVFLARSFNHTGPGQDPDYAAPAFARQIALIEAGRMAPTIDVGNLDAARDITDVRDTVRAYQAIVERGRSGVVYNVCSGKAWRIREVLDWLVAMSRVPVTVRVDPARYRPNDTPVLLGNPSRLRDDTGWTAEIPLEETLASLLDYWRKDAESR